jgi:hypothetical protein
MTSSHPVFGNVAGKWFDGRFVHPHDACFGHGGDIFVAE